MATGFTYRHYILKDHLGSWTTITDAEGNVEQELSFDAWGNLRDADTWTGSSTEAPMFDRGYTGHEHITAFGLINMNGRCYDPVMSSFLSVDEYVQDPSNAQNFNRYSYCLNNPLKYVDPSGWLMKGASHSQECEFNQYRRYMNAHLTEEQWANSGINRTILAYVKMGVGYIMTPFMMGEEQKGGGGGGLKITGDMAKEAFEDLQRGTNMKLDYDSETGMVSYSGMKLKKNGKPYKMTAADEKLLAVIESKNVLVVVESQNLPPTNSLDFVFMGGAFMGAKISEDKTSVQTTQIVAPILLRILDAQAGTEGLYMMHEVTESYTLGLRSLKIGESIEPAYRLVMKTNYNYYDMAHSNEMTTVIQPEININVDWFIDRAKRAIIEYEEFKRGGIK